MPYQTRKELPDAVQSALQDVPHAQDIYKEAFNNAWKEYKNPNNRQSNDSREAVAHQVAWDAVKKKYEKGKDDTWHPKEHT